MADDFGKLHVVLLDDNRNFLSILRATLKDLGLRDIAEFTDPTAALGHLKQVPVNIAFIDLVMPKMNGFEFANAVRHSDEISNPFMPIIMVTGHADRNTVGQAINSGIDELLVKPIRPKAVHNRLLAVTKKPRKYIRTKVGYFGPDRRRRADPNYSGPERRAEPDPVTITHPGVAGEIFTLKHLPANRSESQREGIILID